jgi:hypothetical protein
MNIIDQNILSGFEPVSLDEMDSVKLMNRVDTKFLFRFQQLASILESMKGKYRLLEINCKRISDYETLYFDTPSYLLYLNHHNGRLKRYKIRYRSYVDCNLNYFEIKCKNNKGRTIKNRVKRKEVRNTIDGKSEHLLRALTTLDPLALGPVIKVNFSRMTFVNKVFTERVTMDVNLRFSNDSGAEKDYSGIVIAEAKNGKLMHSDFISLMYRNSIPDYNISKYCLGMASLVHGIKKNNFKTKLSHVQKINRYAS